MKTLKKKIIALIKKIFFYRGFSRRNKLGFITFALLLLGFISLYVVNALHPQGTSAAWLASLELWRSGPALSAVEGFNDNWGFREAIPVTSTEGSAQSNVFVSFTLDTATLISNGKLRTDCRDIRIVDMIKTV